MITLMGHHVRKPVDRHIGDQQGLIAKRQTGLTNDAAFLLYRFAQLPVCCRGGCAFTEDALAKPFIEYGLAAPVGVRTRTGSPAHPGAG